MNCTILVLSFILFLNTKIDVYGWIPTSSHHSVLSSKRTTVTTTTNRFVMKRQASSSTNHDQNTPTSLRAARSIHSSAFLQNTKSSMQLPATRRQSLVHLLTKSGGILAALTMMTSTVNPVPNAAAATAVIGPWGRRCDCSSVLVSISPVSVGAV